MPCTMSNDFLVLQRVAVLARHKRNSKKNSHRKMEGRKLLKVAPPKSLNRHISLKVLILPKKKEAPISLI